MVTSIFAQFGKWFFSYRRDFNTPQGVFGGGVFWIDKPSVVLYLQWWKKAISEIWDREITERFGTFGARFATFCEIEGVNLQYSDNETIDSPRQLPLLCDSKFHIWTLFIYWFVNSIRMIYIMYFNFYFSHAFLSFFIYFLFLFSVNHYRSSRLLSVPTQCHTRRRHHGEVFPFWWWAREVSIRVTMITGPIPLSVPRSRAA